MSVRDHPMTWITDWRVSLPVFAVVALWWTYGALVAYFVDPPAGFFTKAVWGQAFVTTAGPTIISLFGRPPTDEHYANRFKSNRLPDRRGDGGDDGEVTNGTLC